MKSVIRRFLMSGRPANQPMPRREFFTSSRIVVTLSSALLGSVGAPLAMAQGTPSVKAPISPEAMAMHVHAKRAVAAPATTLEPAVALADHGPGGRCIRQCRLHDQLPYCSTSRLTSTLER
jgi:hypothetical protein